VAAFSRKVRQGAARDIVRRCAVGALYRTPRGRRLRLSGRRGASLHARRLTGAPRGAPPPAQPPRVWSDPTICSASGFDLPATHRNVSARWQVACERAATRRGVPNALRGVSRSAAPCGGRRTHEGAAGRANTRRKALPAEPHELTPKAAGPRGAPAAQCRPPRVARSRGTPQRGRRAGDSSARDKQEPPTPRGPKAYWLCDSTFDSSFAVMSTIGITRSYAMRVGPMTPSVPMTLPSTVYGATTMLMSSTGTSVDSPPM